MLCTQKPVLVLVFQLTTFFTQWYKMDWYKSTVQNVYMHVGKRAFLLPLVSMQFTNEALSEKAPYKFPIMSLMFKLIFDKIRGSCMNYCCVAFSMNNLQGSNYRYLSLPKKPSTSLWSGTLIINEAALPRCQYV